jgi:hypothetical protein
MWNWGLNTGEDGTSFAAVRYEWQFVEDKVVSQLVPGSLCKNDKLR